MEELLLLRFAIDLLRSTVVIKRQNYAIDLLEKPYWKQHRPLASDE